LADRDHVMTKAISGLMQRGFKHDATAQHWLVITNRGCVINTIRIYCSLQLKPSDVCMQTVLKFLNSKAAKVKCELMNVVKQAGSTRSAC